MFLLLLRKLWIRRRRPDTHQSSTSLTTPKEVESQDKKSFIPETVTLTPQHDERGQLANQLAALAATVSNLSYNSTLSSIAATIVESQPAALVSKPEQLEQPEQPEEEESFYHLCSLITVSCLPQHMSGHASKPSASALDSKPGKRRSQIFDRKRGSSILSLHIGDLPSLPFPSKGKVPCRPRPRYSPLPPPFVQKRLLIRPQVRF